MSGGHWLCGHPILAESHREGDCYHCVSAHSSNPAWTGKGKAAPSCATSHTQALLPVHTAICLHIPLCLPWQLPPLHVSPPQTKKTPNQIKNALPPKNNKIEQKCPEMHIWQNNEQRFQTQPLVYTEGKNILKQWTCNSIANLALK